mmetsp:Transcript_57216/g.63920  ORF Transcript_57216/g.63920 Transcript_57216/m.63920 type:complete len:107 (+) Transcript_57216:1-321(+)
MTPIKTMIVTHVFVKKLQAVDWSTEKAAAGAPLTICVGVFTPSIKEQRSTTSKEVHDVTMDGVLIQPSTHCSETNKNLCTSYKINSTHGATKTLAVILAFLTNLTD